MDTREYIYTEVNAFNIIFPNSEELTKNTDFPLVDWVTKIRVEGKPWQKIIYIIVAGLTIFLAFTLTDLLIWIVKGIFRKAGELWSVALRSFGAKFLACLGIGVFAFLVFWLIKSGYWQELFSWCSSVAESTRH